MKPQAAAARFIFFLIFVSSVLAQTDRSIKNNFAYFCNGERVIIGRCRKDSDMAGFPPTKPEDNFCQVIYPDRTKRGGLTVETVELRSDVIKKLEACGAFQELTGTPASGSDVNESVRVFKIGDEYFKNKNYEKALELFKRSNAIAPSSAAYIMSGITEFHLKKYADAILDLKETIKMVPNNPEAHYWLGSSYQLQSIAIKDYKLQAKAESEFREAIRLRPDYQGAFLGLGSALHGQRKFQESLTALQQALRLKSDDTSALYLLGFTYVRLGQKENAMQAYNKLASIDPKYATGLHAEINKPATVAGASRSGVESSPMSDQALAARDAAEESLDKSDEAEKFYNAGDYVKSLQASLLAVKASSVNPFALYYLGLSYHRLGKENDAMIAYQNLVRVDDGMAKRLLAEITKPTGNPSSKAILTNEQKPASVQQDPEVTAGIQATAIYIKGKTHWEAKEYAKAIPDLERAIALKVDQKRLVAAYVYLGDSYNATRQYAKAIALMPTAIAIEKDATYYHILANAYERTFQLPKALAALREAVRLAPADALFLSALGSNLVMNGRLAEAKTVYNTLLKIDATQAGYLLDEIDNKRGPVGVLVKRADFGLLNQDEAEALEWFRNAVRLNPTSIDALFDIGGGLAICGKHDEALAVYRRMATLKLTPEERGTLHYFVGQVFNETKNYAKALPELVEANRLHPDYYSKHEIGKTYFETKQFPSALTAFQEAVKFNPKEADGHIMLGRTYAAMGQTDNAVAALQELVKLDPKSARGWVEIGNVNLAANRIPDAGRAFSAALQINPKSASAIFGIGRAHLAMGRKPEAMRAYNALKPLDEALAQQLLNEINKH